MRRVNTPYSFSPLTAETRIRSAVRRLMVMVMCVGLLALGTTPAWAQSNGTVAGVVSDPTGAVVAGANVACGIVPPPLHPELHHIQSEARDCREVLLPLVRSWRRCAIVLGSERNLAVAEHGSS